jgi:hypothetical protein
MPPTLVANVPKVTPKRHIPDLSGATAAVMTRKQGD